MIFRTFFITTFFLLISVFSLFGQTDDELGLHSEGGPWQFFPTSNYQENLPNMLMIGNSVMNGYHHFVIDSLKDKANVDYWLTPKHLKSDHLFTDLSKVVSFRKYDVIQFNIGLHGWPKGRILKKEYKPLLKKYVNIIKENAPSSIIIWASTTPVTEEGKPELNKEINPTIANRNIMAADVMKEMNVGINDLYVIGESNLHLSKGDRFHWKGEGYTLMGRVVVNRFLSELEINVFQKDTIHLWSDKVPGEKDAKHDPVQSPNKDGNVIRVTDITNPAIIVFEPEASVYNGVGIIVCPGGGYNILAIDKEGYEVAEWLNKLGFTAFVLQYRVPKKQAGALNDIQRAIRIVRNESEKWKLNPNKVGVMGFSAGGSLSARASTSYSIESYAPVDKIDSLSCRPDFAILIYPAYLDKGKNRSLTPELLVDNNTPPMFIFGTADDPYGNNSLVMATALRDNKIPVELHMLAHGGHGYGMRPGNIAAETWPLLAEIWLKKVIK